MVAFNFIKKQSQPNLYKIAVVTFDLMSSRHLFVDKIRELIREHHYKEASQLAYELELFHEFSLYELVLPLILQDKISIAEEYLVKAVHLRKPLVQLLDSFLNKSSSVSHNCSNIILKYNYPDVKFNKLQSKPLTKLIIRLAKLYSLPNDTIPNVIRSKNYGALQFLMHKKYGEKSLNKDSWEEMVKETVPVDSLSLQMELIDSCANYGDYAEGAFWARHFRIPAENLPTLVNDYIEQSKNQNGDRTMSDSADSEIDSLMSYANETAESIHLLSLESSQLHLVDTRTKFFAMLRTLTRENMVAFDAEWKPTFFSTNEVALIQLATRQQVFLVDVIQLDISHDDWNHLGRQIFNNMEILKLGFSPTNDLTMFQKLIPGLNLSSLALTSYLDLQELWHRLHSMSQFKFPYELSEETGGTSLNNLVQLCLGRKLDKSNQFSNWEKRPLRQDQLTYAALDAYCLIEIHDVIEREFNRIEIDFNEFINTFLTERKSTRIVLKKSVLSANSQKKPATTVVQAVGPNPNSVGVTNVKFICDIMLGGLSRALRKVGIDAISLTSNDNIDHYIQIAQRENRYFLTRGNFYVRCSKFLPPGHCYNVASDQRHDQLQEVLSYFNLTVTEANAFSRCIRCNGNEFLYVTQNEMSEMTRIPLATPAPQSHDSYLNDQKARSWTLRKLTPYCKEKRITTNGIPIHISVIRKETLNLYPSFYVCEGCGKCYWNGSHLRATASYGRTKKR
ncbi:hypothetical protein HA402_006427 [Bradysia odoriphaga]|nr:hypothetical protein HA402_006427 [Bradysia odoriphaga]